MAKITETPLGKGYITLLRARGKIALDHIFNDNAANKFVSWFNNLEPIEQNKWLEKPSTASESGKSLKEIADRLRQEQMKQENAAMLSKNAKIKKSVAAYYKDKYYIYYRYIIKYNKKYNIRE